MQTELTLEQKRLFLETFCAGHHHSESFLRRLRLVIDLIGLEWVLLVLNVLDPASLARRKFANPGIDMRKLLTERLAKAEGRIQKMVEYREQGPFISVPPFSPLLLNNR